MHHKGGITMRQFTATVTGSSIRELQGAAGSLFRVVTHYSQEGNLSWFAEGCFGTEEGYIKVTPEEITLGFRFRDEHEKWPTDIKPENVSVKRVKGTVQMLCAKWDVQVACVEDVVVPK